MAQKSKTTAAILAFLLGGIGVHDFYLGRTKYAVMHLIMYIVSVIFGILCIIPYIGWILFFVVGLPLCILNSVWAIVEAVKILSNKDFVDGNGNPLA